MATWEDDFEDNDLDLALWEKIEINTGTVEEQNFQLECFVPAIGDGSGVVSKDPYNLAIADVRTYTLTHTAGYVSLQICPTKVTATPPVVEDNYYRFYLDQYEEKCKIVRVKDADGGVVLYSENWRTRSGPLRIVIAAGQITFYEWDDLRYTEAYDLASYVMYTYLTVRPAAGFIGFGKFLEFSEEFVAPPDPRIFGLMV